MRLYLHVCKYSTYLSFLYYKVKKSLFTQKCFKHSITSLVIIRSSAIKQEPYKAKRLSKVYNAKIFFINSFIFH